MTAKPACEKLGLNYISLDWASENYACQEFSITVDDKWNWCFMDNSILSAFNSAEVIVLGDKWYKHKLFAKYNFKDGIKRIQNETDNFTHYKFDYFTNMYLYTYRYYLAKALEYLGDKVKADELISDGISADLKEIGKVDSGYFATTPFFISYIDDNKKAREIYFAYRLYLYYIICISVIKKTPISIKIYAYRTAI